MHESPSSHSECWAAGSIEQNFLQFRSFSQKNIPQQVSALPRTLILLLLFLTAFVWISAILMLIMAARLKWIYWDVAQSFSLRLAITVFTIILVYSVGQMNVVGLSGSSCTGRLFSDNSITRPQFTCLSDNPCKSNFTTDSINDIDDADSHRRCVSFVSKSLSSIRDHEFHFQALPQYISLSASFGFMCVSIFLR